MDKQVKNLIKLMNELGFDEMNVPEEFESETPDEEILYEWSELEGGGFNETK